MLKVMAAVAALATAAAPAAAQAVWDAEELGGGSAEFRLGNGEGAAIILVCELTGVSAGFEFPESLDSAGSASIRGVPGERQNIAVAPVSDRVVRLTTGRGIEALLRLLRNTANLYVRAGGQRATFEVFGSSPLVSQCLERQDEAVRDPTRAVQELQVTASAASSV